MLVMGLLAALGCLVASAQTKVDQQRMDKDIEVAENILSTLIRQQFGKRNFMPMEVNGNYMEGYGVTFRLPRGGPFNMFLINSMDEPNIIENMAPGSYSYSYSKSYSNSEEKDRELKNRSEEERNKARQEMDRGKARTKVYPITPRASRINSDSLSATTDKRFLDAAKDFLADYGDVISQLRPDERIVITNRGENFEGNFNFKWAGGGGESRRSVISAETKRDDIIQLKQGKITRDQFLSRLKIVNTESIDKLDPDLEVLSSMFERLYRPDLSKTYYSESNVDYERLKDFGVIYYMRVFSSNEEGDGWSMPTLALSNISNEERNKKVTELYPKFENDLKENLVEYGRTLRSLKDDEQVVFNVRLTKCVGCGIPASVEVSIKNSALKDYNSGKVSKEATMAKVNVKKVGSQ